MKTDLRSFLLCLLAASGLAVAAPASSPTMSDISTLMPGQNPESVFEQWENPAYGLVVLKNGALGLLYSTKGFNLLSHNGWYFQGAGKDAAGQNMWQHLDTAEFQQPAINVITSPEGFRVYQFKAHTCEYFQWTQRIICKPTSVRIEVEFAITKAPPDSLGANLFVTSKVIAKLPPDFTTPNENPINLTSAAGKALFYYDPNLTWHRGYWVDQNTITLSPLAGRPMVPGETHATWFEVEL